MVTTFTGNNSFALKADLDRLAARFVHEYGDMGLQRLDGDETDYDHIREAIESMPFLSPKKLVIFYSPGAVKEFIEHHERLLTELPDSTDVIIVEPKLDKRSSYYKFLQKKTDYKQFGDLDELAISKWLVSLASEAGGSMSLSTAKHLVGRVGLNQQLLKNEFDKLLAYDLNISDKSVDLLTELSPQSTIFNLIDAAMSGNKKLVMKLYQEQRANKVEPQQIIAMLAWQMHILALVKTADVRSDTDIAREAKISPYTIRKSRQIAKIMSLARIKTLTSNLLDIDIKSKTSSMDVDDAVQLYLLSI
ncbi:MAG: DNA polymerase III subunit delta [Candidatus Saccharimonadales bacterium]